MFKYGWTKVLFLTFIMIRKRLLTTLFSYLLYVKDIVEKGKFMKLMIFVLLKWSHEKFM